MEPVMLSIVVPVYNHEKYLQKALQSIKKQNIRYRYEVLIGEDCSTDGSRNVLKAYECNAPDDYRFIYHNKNQGMFRNISGLIGLAKGKYLTVLEGDDYWICENKINEQIAFLEHNPKYSGYAHRVTVIGADGRKTGLSYTAEKSRGDYTLTDYLNGKLPGQTSGFVYRNYFLQTNLFAYLRQNTLYPLDRFIAFIAVSNGPVYCNGHRWSAYRYVTDKGSSFSANFDGSSQAFADSALSYHQSLYTYAIHRNKGKQCIQVSEKLYYKSFLRSFIQSGCRHPGSVILQCLRAKYPVQTFFWILLQIPVWMKEKLK